MTKRSNIPGKKFVGVRYLDARSNTWLPKVYTFIAPTRTKTGDYLVVPHREPRLPPVIVKVAIATGVAPRPDHGCRYVHAIKVIPADDVRRVETTVTWERVIGDTEQVYPVVNDEG